MPDVGHVAVGLAAARAYERRDAWTWRAGIAFSVLSLLPDADIPVSAALHAPWNTPLGHRGWTHSLFFAALVAAGVWAFSRRRRLTLFAFLVVASHGALDMLDRGRLGVEYLWPLSAKNYFWPLRVLPGGEPPGGLWSWAEARQVLVGTLWFVPCFAYAFQRRLKESATALRTLAKSGSSELVPMTTPSTTRQTE
jgi:inner membrane protein